MSEDYRWAEVYRRLDKVERAAEAVPVISRDINEIKNDIHEARTETRSMRRAFYTLSVSIMSASVIALLTVDRFFA